MFKVLRWIRFEPDVLPGHVAGSPKCHPLQRLATLAAKRPTVACAAPWGATTVHPDGRVWRMLRPEKPEHFNGKITRTPSHPMSAFVTADTHFGHIKSLTFIKPDGKNLRPFDSVEEMDEHMVENWNKTVNKKDTIYHLGDVVIPRASLSILERLNGRKILIRGNHDHGRLKDFSRYFEDVRGAFFHGGDSTMRGGMIFTHIPVHPSCLSGHYLGNIHGHLHSNLILGPDGQPDTRYFNACVEPNNFTPVSFEEIKEYFKNSR